MHNILNAYNQLHKFSETRSSKLYFWIYSCVHFSRHLKEHISTYVSEYVLHASMFSALNYRVFCIINHYLKCSWIDITIFNAFWLAIMSSGGLTYPLCGRGRRQSPRKFDLWWHPNLHPIYFYMHRYFTKDWVCAA